MQIFLFLFVIFNSFHDLHLSMCSIVYNEDAQRIEVQQRIFYDDLEKSLQIQMQNEHFNILKPEESTLDYDSLFQEYANRHIDLYVNDKASELELLEYEISNDAIVLYLFKANVKKLKSIDIFSHILFELFDDQDNVISIQANGKKQSQKFDVHSKPFQMIF
ncbi:DUF6702 family protein [Portibacter marinus]|uniref:DUF6702 family protein n=1 Tax=Portibacter marinus TaxID=2898660 RepID=UPI001F2E70FF|nr:DUF6702 family protein [Portibacter marinus]